MDLTRGVIGALRHRLMWISLDQSMITSGTIGATIKDGTAPESGASTPEERPLPLDTAERFE